MDNKSYKKPVKRLEREGLAKRVKIPVTETAVDVNDRSFIKDDLEKKRGDWGQGRGGSKKDSTPSPSLGKASLNNTRSIQGTVRLKGGVKGGRLRGEETGSSINEIGLPQNTRLVENTGVEYLPATLLKKGLAPWYFERIVVKKKSHVLSSHWAFSYLIIGSYIMDFFSEG